MDYVQRIGKIPNLNWTAREKFGRRCLNEDIGKIAEIINIQDKVTIGNRQEEVTYKKPVRRI